MRSLRKSAGLAMGLLTALAMLVAAPAAHALYVYPAQGQSQEQTQQDQYECHVWAVGQTGYDPTNPSSSTVPQNQSSDDHTILRGALRGAAVGGVVGAITDNNSIGTSMGAGAAAGGLLGAFQRGDQSREAANQQQAAAQADAARVADYNKALTACLQGRGYSVN